MGAKVTTEAKASLHVSWESLSCHDAHRTPFPLDWRDTRLPALMTAFENIRLECCAELGGDCPIIILEGYRTRPYQDMLRQNPVYKAAKNSQHCEGRALDLACPRGMTFEAFTNCVKRASARENSPIRYVELRPLMSYIHVDTRPTKALVIETVA